MKILYLVHQFYPQAYTGTEKFVLQLAQQCQSAGHTVSVVTYDLSSTQNAAPSPALQGLKQRIKSTLQRCGLDPAYLWRLPTRLLPNRITVRRYHYQDVPVVAFAHQRRAARHRSQGEDQLVADFARQLLLHEQPDLIHAGHTIRVAEFLTVAAKLKIPYVMTLTDFWVNCPNCKLVNERQQRCHGPRRGSECRSSCPTFRPAQITPRLAQMHRLLQQATSVFAPSAFLANKIAAKFSSMSWLFPQSGMRTCH